MAQRQVGMAILYQRRLRAPKLEELVGRYLGNYQVRWEDGAALIAERGADDGPEVRLSLEDAPEVLAQSVGIAGRIGREGTADGPIARATLDAIARCDARLVASWTPGDEISDITLDICYLEEDVQGIVFHLNVNQLSDGSFTNLGSHAMLDETGAPVVGAALAARLHGCWRRVAGGGGPDRPAGLTVTSGGDLIHSQGGDSGLSRILLEYRVEDGDLITDQPSHPREERTPISFDGDGRLILVDLGAREIYARETAATAFDPDAALYALAAFALRHGVASAHAGDAMVPFLIGATVAGQRTLVRFVAASPESAREEAERAARGLGPEVTACAYAHDGYVRGPEGRVDAIIVEASRRDRPHALTVALAYLFPPGGGPAQPSGNLITFPDAARSWLAPG
jgi:hypothetical protein